MVEGGSSFSSSLTSVFPTTTTSSSSSSSNYKDLVAISNINLCDISNNNNNITKSPVTVKRETKSNLILNEIQLSSDDINLFNVHDYAIFIQSNLLPEWWAVKIQQRPIKTTNTLNSSNILWAKVRAVTYMTTLGHRTGSWYSDDRTEISPMDDVASLSDMDEKNDQSKIDFDNLETYSNKSDLAVSLRRSFSSIDCIKHTETYSPALSRSRSTTLINSSEHISDSSPMNLPQPQPLPPKPLPQSPSRVYRFLHCILL